MWDVPIKIVLDAQPFIDNDLDQIVQRFNKLVHSTRDENADPYENNKYIKG